MAYKKANKGKRKRNAVLTAIVVVALITAALSLKLGIVGTGVATNKVNVVAAENFWGNIAGQIGGDKVSVTSIISDPNADPHLYESDARDAIAIANADVVIKNGLGYDDFMDKLLSASQNSHRTVLTAASILSVTGEDANPHLWYDTPRLPAVAAQIEATLAAKDPANKAMFEKNLAQFDSSLAPILSDLSNIKQYYRGEPVAYTERVPGYLLANAGLQVVTPSAFASAIEDGNDPSPAATLAMDNLIERHKIRVLMYNAQTVTPVTQRVRSLAESFGVPVIAVTETMPANDKSFQAWQLGQVEELKKDLGGK